MVKRQKEAEESATESRSFQLPVGLYASFSDWAKARGMGAGQAATQAIQQYMAWIDRGDQPPDIPPRYLVYLERLRDALAGGESGAIVGVTAMIDAALTLAALRREAERKEE